MTFEQSAEETRLVLEALRSPESPLRAYEFRVKPEALGNLSFDSARPWHRNLFRVQTPASAHIAVPLVTFSRQLDTIVEIFAEGVDKISSIDDIKERALAAAVHTNATNEAKRITDVCVVLVGVTTALGMNKLLNHKLLRASGTVSKLALCVGVSVGVVTGIVAVEAATIAKRALRERTANPRHLASYTATVQALVRYVVLVAPQWNPVTLVKSWVSYVHWSVARRVYENAV